MTVARKGELPRGVKVGDVIKDRGFVSTSIDASAIPHLNRNAKDFEVHSIEIQLKKGAHAVHVSSGESEVLLQSGATFKVVSLRPTVLEHLGEVGTDAQAFAGLTIHEMAFDG